MNSQLNDSTSYRIAKNLHVEFSFTDGQLNAEWSPEAPPGLPTKLYKKYGQARNKFLQSVAKELDGPVVVFDADGFHTIYPRAH